MSTSKSMKEYSLGGRTLAALQQEQREEREAERLKAKPAATLAEAMRREGGEHE